jgi:hypothetical protein
MPELVLYRTKPTQSSSFFVRYRTEMMDAGMPMPALISSMSMPSYAISVTSEPHCEPKIATEAYALKILVV